MAIKAWEKLYDYFLQRGNRWMVTITLVEIAFYVAFTVVYSLEQFKSSPDDGSGGKAIQEDQIYRWCLTAVLLLALLYFLWHSVSFVSKASIY